MTPKQYVSVNEDINLADVSIEKKVIVCSVMKRFNELPIIKSAGSANEESI